MRSVIKWKQAMLWTMLVSGDKKLSSELRAAYEGLSPTRNLASQVIPILNDGKLFAVWVALFIRDKN